MQRQILVDCLDCGRPAPATAGSCPNCGSEQFQSATCEECKKPVRLLEAVSAMGGRARAESAPRDGLYHLECWRGAAGMPAVLPCPGCGASIAFPAPGGVHADCPKCGAHNAYQYVCTCTVCGLPVFERTRTVLVNVRCCDGIIHKERITLHSWCVKACREMIEYKKPKLSALYSALIVLVTLLSLGLLVWLAVVTQPIR